MAKKLRPQTEEEKKDKKVKRQARKEKKKNEVVEIRDNSDQTFLNYKGQETKLMKFLKKDEVWEQDVKRYTDDNKVLVVKKKIITYDGIKRLAKESGIYNFTKQVLYSPGIENNDLHGFDVTVFCNALLGGDFCTHGYHKTTMVGEASKLNTKSIGEKYKATMAEKRGFCRAVISHLGLVDILGEDELGEPQEIDDTPQDLKRAEFEDLSGILNKILNAMNKDALILVGTEIKFADEGRYSKNQIEYLRKVYKKRLSELEQSNF